MSTPAPTMAEVPSSVGSTESTPQEPKKVYVKKELTETEPPEEDDEDGEEVESEYMQIINAKGSNIQQAFDALKAKGFFAELDVTCCSTCAHAEISSRVKDRKKEGLDPWRGYLYTHQQTMEGVLEIWNGWQGAKKKKAASADPAVSEENGDDDGLVVPPKTFQCGSMLYHSFAGKEDVKDEALEVMTSFGCDPCWDGPNSSIRFTYQSTDTDEDTAKDWAFEHAERMRKMFGADSIVAGGGEGNNKPASEAA